MLTVLLVLIYAELAFVLVTNVAYLRRGRALASLQKPPFVSVLIPARNEEANLQRLLPSLLRQSYPSFEVIVYDDGSEDGTSRVVSSLADARLRLLRGDGPPAGWVGKVHALFQASREARGERYLFLDADAELLDADALTRLVQRFEALPERSVLTGLTRLKGGGKLLVSLVPSAILVGLPWILVPRLRWRGLAALNGQCWLIDARDYHTYEPHEAHPDEVLEDVVIGRYLKARGMTPYLRDVQDEVAVYMYASFGDAWRGFRKNAYLIMGGQPLAFLGIFAYAALTFVVAPWTSAWFLGALYLLKGATDRLSRFPWWIVLAAPLTFVVGAALQLDSAWSHWTGRVAWKGRRVGSR